MDACFRKNGDRYTLEIERHLDHSPDKVWRVLTERELLKQWFPCDVEGEWKVGAALRFHFMHGEGDSLSEDELSGEVLTFEPPHLLEFRWSKNVIRCELTADGDGCKLVFSETLDDASAAARNSAGWEMCLEGLNIIASGATIGKFAWDAWQAKFSRYAKKFEPEFGPQQGPPDNSPADETE